MPVHDEKRGSLSPRDRIAGRGADVVERDENAPREGGLALDLAPEDQQVGLGQSVLFPLRFQQVDLSIQLERAVDLLADNAKRLPGFELKYLKQPVQQLFQGEAGPVAVAVGGKLEEFLP